MTARASLDGVRVLDLSRLFPGPYCTLLLSDLGASVDKLEDPHAGDYLRLFPSGWPNRAARSGKFIALNRDKRSVVLDLKQEAGREALVRLVRHYDVLVESFRPGVMDRLGLSDDVLWKSNPKLVICAISGYGKEGPYRDHAAHDLNCVGLSGLLGVTGPSDAPPAAPGTPLADLSSGLFAATAICAALYAAQRDGHGSRVDVSMAESVFGLVLPALGDLAVAPLAPRGRDHLTGGVANYGVYRTADDKLLTVAALEPKFWALFCKTIGRASSDAELLASPDEQARIRDDVQRILSSKTRAEWEVVFADVDACCTPLLEPSEVVEHPLYRDSFIEVDGLRMPRTPFDARTHHTPAPAQGEHTIEILREAGFTDDEIAGVR